MPIERRRALYEGRVQGVGFRFTAQHLAQGFPVSGFVRNLPDGRVELVAEGEPADLSAFLDAVANEMGRFIHEVRVEPQSPGSPPLDGFSIRY